MYTFLCMRDEYVSLRESFFHIFPPHLKTFAPFQSKTTVNCENLVCIICISV